MDIDTLQTISRAIHFIGVPVAVVALWLESLVGFFDSQIPEEYR